MNKYILLALAGIIIFAGILLMHQMSLTNKYKAAYLKELQNVEAYRASNSSLQNEVLEYKMTVGDLRTSKDSIDNKLAQIIDELKLKDKKIEYLQYQTKTIYKTDTLQLSDTLFIPTAHVDTTLGDKWYTLGLKLDYPSTIVVTPKFNTEQYVVISNKKEFNKTPSKVFFIRWFQKKHQVVVVNIEEKCPYVTNKESKFIKVLK